jgi:putative DNA primase/helicase
MKRLVGGEPIQANRMKRDPVTFNPSHTLIMSTNHLPQVSGDDPAVWRRLLVVPFEVVIPEAERDPYLPTKLMEADVQRAVLAWVYAGYREYVRGGLRPPDVVRARTTSYRGDYDHLGRFLEECVSLGGAGRVTAKVLHAAYSEWMRVEFPKEPVEGSREFGKDLVKRGLAPIKSSGVMIYRGMHLIMDDGTDTD